MSEAGKEKMRALTRSEKTRKKIGDANRKRVITDETRAKLSKATSNQSEAARLARSEAAKRRWARERATTISPAAHIGS